MEGRFDVDVFAAFREDFFEKVHSIRREKARSAIVAIDGGFVKFLFCHDMNIACIVDFACFHTLEIEFAFLFGHGAP